jgi:hypothetical protein
MSRQVANALFAVLVAGFCFLHLYRMGAVSFTWDEGSDLGIVSCLQRTHDPFACLDDISQTRFPFYVHALAHSTRGQYAISFLFSLASFAVLYLFARREFGLLPATLAAALFATSPALLASGRMLLTHSNAIFTTFTLLSFVTPFEYAKSGRRGWLAACAIASGLAVASHALGLFNCIGLGIVYFVCVRERRWRDLGEYGAVASAAFFAATIVYVKPSVFRALVDACLHPGAYPFWNYFEMGTAKAPWFFPFLILVVKVGPFLVFCGARGPPHSRFLFAFGLGLLVDLVLKGFVFHYEAPHHQVQFYPLLYLLIAVVIARAWRAWVAAAVAALFALQLYDVVRFFPNYLFYGSQYGDRAIGEFYGPAVMHAQDRGPLEAHVDAILAREPNAKFLLADHNALERTGPNFVLFSQRDPNATYEYAFVDRLYGKHFRFPERDPFNAFLAQHYTEEWTYFFPPHVWMYRVLRVSRGTFQDQTR